jgi:hypothetical protein
MKSAIYCLLCHCLVTLTFSQGTAQHVEPLVVMNPGFGNLVLRQPTRLWRTYLHHLDRSPVLTKTFTSVCAAILGDALAQQVSRPKEIKEWRRVWVLGSRDALLTAPSMVDTWLLPLVGQRAPMITRRSSCAVLLELGSAGGGVQGRCALPKEGAGKQGRPCYETATPLTLLTWHRFYCGHGAGMTGGGRHG